MRTKNDRKLFTSMGPWHIYMKLSLLTFYTPYWRKICRMLSNLRSMNHMDFKGDCHRRMEKYARQAYKDTKLPDLVKWTLAGCIEEEFNIKM